jgi:hypothetical protein
VADGWCWFVLREKYCWLVAGGLFVLREKYCWLVADKPSEQVVSILGPQFPFLSREMQNQWRLTLYLCHIRLSLGKLSILPNKICAYVLYYFRWSKQECAYVLYYSRFARFQMFDFCVPLNHFPENR